MKLEIDSTEDILNWCRNPQPAIFQGQDLREFDDAISPASIQNCVFLGCQLGPKLGAEVLKGNCSVIRKPEFIFHPFRHSLYTPEELYNKYDVELPHSYKSCLDREIYCTMVDCTREDLKDKDKPVLVVDVEELLMRRIHDASISEALDDLLDEATCKRTVAVMGGHDVLRNAPAYQQTVRLAYQLARSGYFIATGGGPGLMEAANFGAYLSGFDDGITKVDDLINILSKAPKYDHPDWLECGFRAKAVLGVPNNKAAARNLGIPTWFYGHEPPNVFATDIAKYFENSVREEGLLAIAWGGVIFAQGNGGTVQEIFQDANQNYYSIFGKMQSPMILLGKDFWHPEPGKPYKDKQKPVYPLLMALAQEKNFAEKVLLTDSSDEILSFLAKHSPIGTSRFPAAQTRN